MRRNRALTITLTAIVVAALAPPANAGVTKTIVVDCASGDEIASALTKSADELIVEISGICDEEIVIERDNVTLRGTDPAVDGIRGVGVGHVVTIRRAVDTAIENLAILDGSRDGISILSSDGVSIVNSRITGHARNGISSNGGQFIRFSDLEIDAGNWGWSAVGDSSCTRCTINGGSFGWVAFEGQQSIRDSTVTGGSYGVWSQTTASLSVIDSTVSGGFSSGVSFGNASLSFNGSTLDGALFCVEQSSLLLNNTQQLSGPGFNSFQDQSHVSVANGSELLGSQFLDRFSNIAIEDGAAGTSLISGDLFCNSGSDAWCPDAATNVTGSSCGQCL